MSMKRSSLFSVATAVLALSACSNIDREIELGGQYWQRVNTSDAIYQQGPKAQQMLNRDIAGCVTELQELEKLGDIKNAIPTDRRGRVIDPSSKALSSWDTPNREGHLLAEHSNYHDFEGCMLYKGWERVKHVPYSVAGRARKNYLDSHVDYKYESRIGYKHRESQASGSYNTTNIND